MSIAAAALGLSRALSFQGKEYQLKPLTYEGCARISLWLEERSAIAMQRLIRSGAVNEKAAIAGHLANVAAGKFEPGGDAFQEVLEEQTGFRKLVELMLDLPPEDSQDAEGKPVKGAKSLSWEIAADDTAANEAHRLIRELNSDPLAIRQRRIPT